VIPVDKTTPPAPLDKETENTTVSAPQIRRGFQVENANFNVNKQKKVTPNSPNQNQGAEAQPVVYEPLPGEESYIKTIATLERTVDDKKDEVLKPSSRLAFEKDLALVNDAISKMKAQVKKNPKNEAAKQVLLASYENKIDLLNSVAGKTELMASMR
jgi:hypothetical protein